MVDVWLDLRDPADVVRRMDRKAQRMVRMLRAGDHSWSDAHEPAAFGGHKRPGAGLGQAVRDVDGSALRSAGLEFRNDLQDGPTRQRMEMRGRKGRPAGSR